MSNYPSMSLYAAAHAPWNAPDHRERCPAHPDQRPSLDALIDAARQVVNVNDEETLSPQNNMRLSRIERAVDELRKVLDGVCACDEIERGLAEAAEDAMAEERADREDPNTP